MKHILLVKNLRDETQVTEIEKALMNTRVSYEVNLLKKCVIVNGNQDMVFIVRKALQDLGFVIL